MRYVVVESNNCSDPMVYGPFPSLKKAETFKKKHEAKFTDFDWRHDTYLDITELKTPN